MVIDPFFVGTSYFADIKSALESAGIGINEWSGVIPDPTDVSVDDAVKIYRENNCDGVICIGGGSAMDTGKSVVVVIGSVTQSIREHWAPPQTHLGYGAGNLPTNHLRYWGGVYPYSMITNTATGYKELGYPAWEMLVAQSVAIVDPGTI